jgi:Flp pilus assembly protein TadB
MTTALLAGVLAGLFAATAGRRLRSLPRSAHPRGLRAAPAAHGAGDLSALLDGIARQVRSGSSLTSAVCDEIGSSSALREVADRLAGGGSLVEALANVTPGDADLSLTIHTLSATAHLGGPIAATLDEAAAVLRERAAARAERHAQGSQARLSGRVLTIVPLCFAVWSALASQRTREVYTSTVAGGVCVACGLLLNVTGWRWMKRIIGSA